MEQHWNHVLFLHFRIDANAISDCVPFDLDLFEGQAVLSIVPFQMDQIRFPPLPSVPWVSSLWELNLRTYVRVNGVKGVYFFTLDTDSALATLIANRFYHLPYRRAQMEASVSGGKYQFASAREDGHFQVSAKISEGLKEKTEFERWATDREHLFTRTEKGIYQGTVIHEDWKFQTVELLSLLDDFSTQLPVQLNSSPDAASYCRHLKVRFLPFQFSKSKARSRVRERIESK